MSSQRSLAWSKEWVMMVKNHYTALICKNPDNVYKGSIFSVMAMAAAVFKVVLICAQSAK